MNSRSAHLTLTTSPISTKSGTWMIAPVSKVASLDWPVDAAFFRPGSVYVTSYVSDVGVAHPQ